MPLFLQCRLPAVLLTTAFFHLLIPSSSASLRSSRHDSCITANLKTSKGCPATREERDGEHWRPDACTVQPRTYGTYPPSYCGWGWSGRVLWKQWRGHYLGYKCTCRHWEEWWWIRKHLILSFIVSLLKPSPSKPRLSSPARPPPAHHSQQVEG